MRSRGAPAVEGAIRSAAIALFEARSSLECNSHSNASHRSRSTQPHTTMPDEGEADAVRPVIHITTPDSPRKRDFFKRSVRRRLGRRPSISTQRAYIHPLEESPGRRMRHTDDYLTERNPNPKTGLVTPEVVSANSSTLEVTDMPTPESPGAALALRVPAAYGEARSSRQKHRWRANKEGWYYVERSPSPAVKAFREGQANSSQESFHSDRFAVVTPALDEPREPPVLEGKMAEQVAAYEHYARRARLSQATVETRRVSLIEYIISTMPGALPSDPVPSIALAELDTAQPQAPAADRKPSVRVAIVPRKPVPSPTTTPPPPPSHHSSKPSWFTGPSGTAVPPVSSAATPAGATLASTPSSMSQAQAPQPAAVDVRLRGAGARRGAIVAATAPASAAAPVPAPAPATTIAAPTSKRTRTPLFTGPIVSLSAEAAVIAGRRAMTATITSTTTATEAVTSNPIPTPPPTSPRDPASSCEVDFFGDVRRHAATVVKALLAFYLLLCFLHVVDAVREAAWRVSWPARSVIVFIRFVLFGWGSG